MYSGKPIMLPSYSTVDTNSTPDPKPIAWSMDDLTREQVAAALTQISKILEG